MTEHADKDALIKRLEIKPGDTVNRFKCRYLSMGPNADEVEMLCQEHNRSPSPYSFEFGPHRPCHRATMEDKLPLTITQFLHQMAYESRKKAENSVLVEDHTRIAEVIDIVLKWHESWPVLVQKPPKFEQVRGDDLEQVVFRMTQEMDWMSTKAYKEKFGTDSPVAPLIRQLAQMWDDHSEFREEWRIG